MGYTNYLEISNDCPESLFTDALKADLLKVIKKGKGVLVVERNNKRFIAFNGIDEDSHESCVLPLVKSESQTFSFCKTNRKPYDKYVLACYFVMKAHLGNYCKIGSDGCGNNRVDDEVKEALKLFVEVMKDLEYVTPEFMFRKPELAEVPKALAIVEDKAVKGKLPDSKTHENRMEVLSETSDKAYIVSRRKSNGNWECSCFGWIRHRHCKHLDALRPLIEGKEKQKQLN